MESRTHMRADEEMAELQEHYAVLSALADAGCHEAMMLCISLTEPDPMRDAHITMAYVRATTTRLQETFRPPALPMELAPTADVPKEPLPKSDVTVLRPAA